MVCDAFFCHAKLIKKIYLARKRKLYLRFLIYFYLAKNQAHVFRVETLLAKRNDSPRMPHAQIYTTEKETKKTLKAKVSFLHYETKPKALYFCVKDFLPKPISRVQGQFSHLLTVFYVPEVGKTKKKTHF